MIDALHWRLVLGYTLSPRGVKDAIRRRVEQLRGEKCTRKPLRGPQTVHCPTPYAGWAKGSRVRWSND